MRRTYGFAPAPQPARQRKAVVRLQERPAVRRREVGDAVVLEDTGDLSEMGERLGPSATSSRTSFETTTSKTGSDNGSDVSSTTSK